MTNHKKITQIMLIMLGIFLILATYVYGPLSQKRKIGKYPKEEILHKKYKVRRANGLVKENFLFNN